MSDEIKLEFVDTNIFVYANDAAAGKKHETAKKLVGQLWKSQSGCISIQVLQELYVSLTKKVNPPVRLYKSSLGIFETRKGTLDFQFLNCLFGTHCQ